MTMERRNHIRSSLRLPVFLMEAGGAEPIRTQTENVSKDGLFAFTSCPLAPGDQLRFVLLLPDVAEITQTAARICVHGELEVVRVCPDFERGLFGIGYRLTNYRVLPDSGALSTEDLVRKILKLCISAPSVPSAS